MVNQQNILRNYAKMELSSSEALFLMHWCELGNGRVYTTYARRMAIADNSVKLLARNIERLGYILRMSYGNTCDISVTGKFLESMISGEAL